MDGLSQRREERKTRRGFIRKISLRDAVGTEGPTQSRCKGYRQVWKMEISACGGRGETEPSLWPRD